MFVFLKHYVHEFNYFFQNKRIETIFNGIDINTFHPIHDSSIRERYHIGNKK